MFTREFHKCEKPDCFRQVKAGIVYCCTPCAVGASGKYEVEAHEHSAGCNQRSEERGPWLTAAERTERLIDEALARRKEGSR